MTLFVISDTHVPEMNRKIPEDFLKQIKTDDILLHAGDFTKLKTLRELEKKCRVYAVRGNMDDPEVKKVLTEKRIVEISGKKIGILHGWGTPFNLAQKAFKKFEESLDVIIFGHSHTPYHQRIDKTLLFNPGSLAGTNRTYGILRLEDEEIWADVKELK